MGAILVVDDDSDLIDTLALILEEEGYHVVGASTEDEAIAIAREVVPRLTLVDYHVPGIDAAHLITRLRETVNTRVVLCTAAEVPAELASQTGAEEVLAKPFNIEDLLAVAREAFRHEHV